MTAPKLGLVVARASPQRPLASGVPLAVPRERGFSGGGGTSSVPEPAADSLDLFAIGERLAGGRQCTPVRRQPSAPTLLPRKWPRPGPRLSQVWLRPDRSSLTLTSRRLECPGCRGRRPASTPARNVCQARPCVSVKRYRPRELAPRCSPCLFEGPPFSTRAEPEADASSIRIGPGMKPAEANVLAVPLSTPSHHLERRHDDGLEVEPLLFDDLVVVAMRRHSIHEDPGSTSSASYRRSGPWLCPPARVRRRAGSTCS